MIRRALLLSTGERYLTITVNFAMLALVSRILTPVEIGVSVIGMSIIGIALAFREFASSQFLIQKPELTREDIRAAFGVILVLTLVIALALAISSRPLAQLFNEPGLDRYLKVISGCILIDTLSTHVISLLRREMAFGKVAVLNTTLALTSAVVTVTLAIKGFSYMSFALGWLVASIVASAMAVCFRPHLWMYRPSLRRARAMVRFGGYNGGSYLLFMMAEHLPYALLGKIVSMEATAIYNRALTISQIPEKIFIGGAVPVILPALASEAREGRSVKKAYLHGLEIITVLQWPALLVLAVLASPVVDIVLGNQWHDSIPIVRIVAIASLFSFSFALNDPALMAIGHVRDVFIRALITFPVVMVAITLAALIGGLEMTAWSLMFVIPFRAFIAINVVCRRLSMRWRDIGVATWRSLAVASTTVAVPLAIAVSSDVPFEFSISQTVAAVCAAGAGWLAGLWMTDHPMRKEIFNAMAHIRASRASPSPPSSTAAHLAAEQDVT
ncbi:oligosaccharide flippase family protein [Oricola thermophila]|uniref:Oligosaccharide flippase family protein n=1 Tax=Oricola thermophila TaxID=2742145 RepID=A0A6N1VAF3_9HYPH|nr:oligosaccharide flippase family protein [Oricola thermophila]QKV17934.1 oligosaccharide flippase family protein [Oricola thermophila]